MDDHTKRVLGDIGARAPQRRLTKTVVDTELESAAREAVRDPKFKGNRKKVEKMIEDGHFRQSEEVIDEAAVAEIDAYNTREVQAAIDRGDIPDPKDDPFMKERLWRQAHKDPNAVSSYQSLMAGIKASRAITPRNDYVLIQAIPVEEKTTAGIIIPDSAKKQASSVDAVIFRVGDKCKYVDSKSEGKRCIVRIYDFDPITVDKTLFLIGREDGILGIYTE